MGFNQKNVDEAGCPPDDPNYIPYPHFNHSTQTATIKGFLLKGLKLVLLALLIFCLLYAWWISELRIFFI